MTYIKKNKFNFALFTAFLAVIGLSAIFDYQLGQKMGSNFVIFASDMVKILPPAFILIGLFEVWVSRETIEANFGQASGSLKYLWSILLAATTVGGTFVAFPVGNSLYHKGAGYNSVFAYVTFASLVMIPMSVIEASILGLEFTLLRISLSIPLVIIGASLLGKYFVASDYQFPEEE